MLLTEDKTSHLAHLILNKLTQTTEIKRLENDDKVLREIKRIIANEMGAEEEINQAVKAKISSLSRPVYEGSPEWEVLYQKFLSEERNKRMKR